MAGLIDEIGNKYGRLTVIERAGSNKFGAALWACECDCGNETIVTGICLRKGDTRSCGCLRQDQGTENLRSRAEEANRPELPKGQAACNHLWRSYQWGAKKRGLKWELSKEQFAAFTKRLCFYCGAEPSKPVGDERYNGDYIYNGIDRVDNDKGYVIGNVVPCCETCNSMKSNLGFDEFIEAVNAVAWNHSAIELPY